MAPRIDWSSTARSVARSISPRAARARACCSSAGRRRLPTWSARNGGFAAPPDLPGEGIGRAARIGPRREDAGLRITTGHHRAVAAGSDLGDRVAERAQLRASALGNPRLDVEPPGPVDARIEGV